MSRKLSLIKIIVDKSICFSSEDHLNVQHTCFYIFINLTKKLEEKSQYLPSKMFSPGLLVIHNSSASCQYNVSETQMQINMYNYFIEYLKLDLYTNLYIKISHNIMCDKLLLNNLILTLCILFTQPESIFQVHFLIKSYSCSLYNVHYINIFYFI